METNGKQQSSGAQATEANIRRGPLEKLSRDELVAKCKGLLSLAQKAKQAKDEYAEKNKSLLIKLSEYETQKDADKSALLTMKELIDNITEHKLTQTTKICDLEKENNTLKVKINELENKLSQGCEIDIRNEALQRQLKRLTDENEDLINDLQKMESKFLQTSKEYDDYQRNSEELIQQATFNFDEVQCQLNELQIEHEKLKEMSIANQNQNCSTESFSNELAEIKLNENRLLEEIQYLKNKIKDALKYSQDVLKENQKEYTESVSKWQNDIKTVSQKLLAYVRSLEDDKNALLKVIKSTRNSFNCQEMEYSSNMYQKIALLVQICDRVSNESEVKDKEILELKLQISKHKENVNETDSPEAQSEDTTIANEQLGKLQKENQNLQQELKMKFDEIERLREVHTAALIGCGKFVKESDYIIVLEEKIKILIELCNRALNQNFTTEKEFNKMKASTEMDKESIEQLTAQIENLKLQLSNEINDQADLSNLKKENELLKQTMQEIESKHEALNTTYTQVTQLEKLTQEKYNDLAGKFDELRKENNNRKETEKLLKEEICDIMENTEQQNNGLKITIQKNAQSIDSLRTENNELLNEMRELNEALKARGDVISRQKDKIELLEAEIKQANNDSVIEMQSKDEQLTKTQISKDLSLAVTTNPVNDNQSEVMSLCSISRTDESVRLQEVNDSLEEKYNKLRVLAVKMKKKLQEQKLVIAKLEKPEDTAETNNKNATVSQIADTENAKLLEETKNLQNRIAQLEAEVKALEISITSKNASLLEKEKQLELEIKAKKSKEQTINEKTNEIRVLKQEKDAFNLIRKELEKERDVLKAKFNDKEKEMIRLNETLDKLKKELEKSKAIGKQSNVLNLEIEAYEKSLNENAEKLNTMKIKNHELEESIQFHESTISSLKREIQILEENLNSEKSHSNELKSQMNALQAKSKQIEHEKLELQSKLQECTIDNEQKNTQVEELSLQISEVSAIKDKQLSELNLEKDKLNSQLLETEQKLNQSESKQKLLELDLDNIRTEFASYKIRAQSVLRQNQNKETSRERELDEELTAMRTNFETLNIKLTKSAEELRNQEKKMDDMKLENERVQKRSKEIMNLMEESREQYESLLEENRKQGKDYQESLKAHRLQIETLTNCYKEQIAELEQKHKATVEEIKKINSSTSTARIAPFGSSTAAEHPQKSYDEQKVEMLLMEREDAEGSEASYSVPKRKLSATTSRSKHDLIPLDELLNSSIDENAENEEFLSDEDRKTNADNEIVYLKEKLQAEESKCKHLTSLLSETEQDLIKYTQLNELLKEELRRQERTLEREKHMPNSEYLKNVIIKFLTLSSGDERLRLVPVINTILRLSPEEANTLQNVAKGGDTTNRSWNLLPIWSNNNS